MQLSESRFTFRKLRQVLRLNKTYRQSTYLLLILWNSIGQILHFPFSYLSIVEMKTHFFVCFFFPASEIPPSRIEWWPLMRRRWEKQEQKAGWWKRGSWSGGKDGGWWDGMGGGGGEWSGQQGNGRQRVQADGGLLIPIDLHRWGVWRQMFSPLKI